MFLEWKGLKIQPVLIGVMAKGFAVVTANARIADGLAMKQGGISFIGCPAIGGIFLVKDIHIIVPVSFSQDGSCRDG